MSTIEYVTGRVNASAGIAVSDPSAAENAIVGTIYGAGGNLIELWDAVSGVRNDNQSGFRWRGRVQGYELTQAGSAPCKRMSAAINGLPAIGFRDSSWLKDMAGRALLPTSGSYSVLAVIKLRSTEAGYRGIFGTAETANLQMLQHRNDNFFEVRRQNYQYFTNAGPLALATAATLLFSWNEDESRVRLRINGTQVKNIVQSKVSTNSDLTVGGYATGAGSTSGATEADPDLFACVAVFNTDLQATANAAQLTAVETNFARARWATW